MRRNISEPPVRRMSNGQLLMAALGCAVLLGCVLLMANSGCKQGSSAGRLPMSIDQTVRAVMTNTASLPGNHSPLFRHEPGPGEGLPWKVHVDLSASLQGFVNPKDSAFREFLDRVGQRLPNVQFEGVGERRGSKQPLAPADPADFF